MLTDPNMIMALHKSREYDLKRRAESSMLRRLARPNRVALRERFMQPLASLLTHLALK